MEQVSATLQGFQQALIPEIEAYWLENPITPEQHRFQVGDRVRLRLGQFSHRGVVADVGEVCFCDRGLYRIQCGSGDSCGGWYAEDVLELATKRRVQVGWIEERWGNKSREKQSLSLYYCYYASEWELHGEGSKTKRKKQRIYLQVHQCQEISRLVHNKRPYTEILDAIGRTKRHGDRLHHMTVPKI